MTSVARPSPKFAIACGGTGGHLFPGLAIADQLARRGCSITLLISPKEVDQQAVRQVQGMEIATLPAVGLTQGGKIAFARGFLRSFRASMKVFASCPPEAVLAMGGFTGAAPILAAKKARARTFLHESNSVAGRANRWLSWAVDQVFVGFPSAAGRLHNRTVIATGTPVRSEFEACEPAACRSALGLDPARPVILVMGGSQGANGINDLVIRSLPLLAQRMSNAQWIHLTGTDGREKIEQAYGALNLGAVVRPFLSRMDLALGAATVAISRAGASSLAELAAMRLPAVLVPYPAAVDNHQFHNARAFEASGAARLLEQKSATPEILARLISDLTEESAVRAAVQRGLTHWHFPKAAEQIADRMLAALGREVHKPTRVFLPSAASGIRAVEDTDKPSESLQSTHRQSPRASDSASERSESRLLCRVSA